MEDIRLENILLIENNDDDAHFIEVLLKRSFCFVSPRKNFQVIKTGTISEALQIVKSQVIDFIFLDSVLSNKQSLEDYGRLRDACPVSPIILLTDYYNIDKASEMIAKGAQDYILKSKIDQEGLERVLRYGLERAETLRLKQEILSMVIHDLKTPITVTSESIAIVLDGLMGDLNHEQRNFLAMAHRNMSRLSDMVDNLRESAAIELGKVNLHKERINITKFLKEISDSFLLPFKGKSLELKNRLPEKDVYVYGDEEKLSHVIMNLISNSLKYTEKGFVEISLAEKTECIECGVKDTGPGIPDEYGDKVFLKYVRTKEMIETGKKGIGLGLAIAKGIVDAHGGKIWMTSEAGKGTTVSFTIPKE